MKIEDFDFFFWYYDFFEIDWIFRMFVVMYDFFSELRDVMFGVIFVGDVNFMVVVFWKLLKLFNEKLK